jgi:hypothetical protein
MWLASTSTTTEALGTRCSVLGAWYSILLLLNRRGVFVSDIRIHL